MLIGFTLCKNANKYQYPIELCIEQHKDLLTEHWFIVPKKDQDTDGTVNTIVQACYRNDVTWKIFEVDWPGDEGFGQESIDKIQQQRFIDEICPNYPDHVWFIKLDADEFLHEKDFPTIINLIKEINDTGITSIAINYIQFLGSVEYTCFDPTERTTHLFKNSSGAFFPGNDAMNIFTSGDEIYLEDVFVHHIGYVKSEDQLSIKLREHFLLNESVYKDVSENFKSKDNIRFKFPRNQKSAKLWPLGIAVLRGIENAIEYRKFNTDKLPLSLRQNIEKLRFHLPME
jgi:hypothetical protein